jgi:hypothetical protein
MLGKKLIEAAAGAGGEVLGIEDVFSTWLYTGNGGGQAITNGIDLAGEGGLVWIKRRDVAASHVLYDTARGTGKYLNSDLANAEATYDPAVYDIKSFDSTGFTLGQPWNSVNNNGNTFASWTFRKAPGFFDVVTYTGDGVAGRTVAHNLGSVPGCIIVKRLDSTSSWYVYHQSIGRSAALLLNTTNASLATDAFANTDPTASVFSVGNNINTNGAGATYVSYLFAHDEQIFGEGGDQSVIKCGTFNDSSAGTVNLGWEPQWILYRSTAAGNNWNIFDNMRGWPASGNSQYLWANSSGAEGSTAGVTTTSTGFNYPAYGAGDWIYIAIRRGPMKTPTDATKVFFANARTGNGSSQTVSGVGFSPDSWLCKNRNSSLLPWVFDRLRGPNPPLSTYTTNDESTNTSSYFGGSPIFTPTMDGFATIAQSQVNTIAYTYIDWMFRRAPGFFDVVAYTGNSSNYRQIAHNLGVAPEFIVVKRRSSTSGWTTYSATLGPAKYLSLNLDTAETASDLYWADTNPTSSVFTVDKTGGVNAVNQSGSTYIAYLFATCPGVSKVGSYTGTGNAINVDCGFTAGARFVMIKRTDSQSDWCCWDTARGIVVGNDPTLALNNTAAEYSTADFIAPLSSGFQIVAGAPTFNANGGTYIYLAIA